MYFRSKFLEISKPIHFWNHQSMGYPKINVGICAYTVKAAILDFQNGRHKIRILRYLGSGQHRNLNKYANPIFSGPRNAMVA